MLVHNMSFTYHLKTSKHNKQMWDGQIGGEGVTKKTQGYPSSDVPWECDRKCTTLPTNFKELREIVDDIYREYIVYQALC